MMDRGQRAREILDDPLVKEAFEVIEQGIRDLWKTTPNSDAREELWYTQQGMERFRNHLETAISNSEYEIALEEKQNAKDA